MDDLPPFGSPLLHRPGDPAWVSDYLNTGDDSMLKNAITADGEPCGSFQGYCVACKGKIDAIEGTWIHMKNGKPARQGRCPTCGRKVFKIGGGA